MHDNILIDYIIKQFEIVDPELINISTLRAEKEFRSIGEKTACGDLLQPTLQRKLLDVMKGALSILGVDLREIKMR